MKSAAGLLQHCKNAVDSKVKYVYGCKMEILTAAKYQQLKNLYKSYVWDSDKNKIGKMCCDCSGLISSYTGIVRNSSGYKSTATEIVTVAELKANWNKYVAWGIWLSGHIGVVSDKEGYYYAMDGSNRNAVHNPLSKQKWVYVIKLRDVTYQENKESDNQTVDVFYRAYANSRWYEEVKNYNNQSTDGYAGVENKPIQCVMARLSKGTVECRVHIKGGRWLPWVDGYNVSDFNNGYAGDGKNAIDGVQFKLVGLNGFDIYYRVSTVSSKSYLPWVKNTEDYAGVYGTDIDKLQVYVKKK